MSDWLMAAEYVMSEGNLNVVLCERGVKGLFQDTRNMFDLSIIPLVRQETHLPVVADPSHGTGVRRIVPQMALAAIACGADGLMIEVHPEPDHAWSDGFQQLDFAEFRHFMDQARPLAAAVGRVLA
jgi:3-deoxy-7-phosphoheptulonate synthase